MGEMRHKITPERIREVLARGEVEELRAMVCELADLLPLPIDEREQACREAMGEV